MSLGGVAACASSAGSAGSASDSRDFINVSTGDRKAASQALRVPVEGRRAAELLLDAGVDHAQAEAGAARGAICGPPFSAQFDVQSVRPRLPIEADLAGHRRQRSMLAALSPPLRRQRQPLRHRGLQRNIRGRRWQPCGRPDRAPVPRQLSVAGRRRASADRRAARGRAPAPDRPSIAAT